MKNPICISTGFLYKLSEDMNEKIKMLKHFSIDGIELCFADVDDILRFSINKENLKYLQSLKFNSIHSPWKMIDYEKNENIDTLIMIERLYKQINAKNVDFHIFDIKKMKKIEIFNKYEFIFSIENDDGRRLKKPGLNTVGKIAKALMINKNSKFTFDFAHALAVSSKDIPKFINEFKNRLSQIHLSYLTKDMKDHWFLFKHDTPKLKKLLNYIKEADVPVVLECVASNWNEVPFIKKEIEYIKSI